MFYVPPKKTFFSQCRREAVLGTFSPCNLSHLSLLAGSPLLLMIYSPGRLLPGWTLLSTTNFCKPQGDPQLVQTKLTDLHAREHQMFLKQHPSLQFQKGNRVWGRALTDHLVEHRNLEQLWQGPAEIMCKVSTNT